MIITNITSKISNQHHNHYHDRSGLKDRAEQKQHKQHQPEQSSCNELCLKPGLISTSINTSHSNTNTTSTAIINNNIIVDNSNERICRNMIVIRPRNKSIRTISATYNVINNKPQTYYNNIINKQTRMQNYRHHNHDHHHHSRSSSYLKRISLSHNINKSKSSTSYALTFAIMLTLLTAIVLLLTLTTSEANALNCYTCSSADNPACDESFSGRANITDTDCEKHIGRPAKVCRKIVQYIEHKKVVIRSCGWIDERADGKDDRKPMCNKRSGTFALMMESCVCYEDNCNHSASLVPNQSVLLLLLLFTGCSAVYSYLTKQIEPISKRCQQ